MKYKIQNIYGKEMPFDTTITGALINNDIRALDIIKARDDTTKSAFDKVKVLYKYGDLYLSDGLQMELAEAPN